MNPAPDPRPPSPPTEPAPPPGRGASPPPTASSPPPTRDASPPDVAPLSLSALVAALAAGELSPVEAVEASLERCAVAQRYGAFVVVDDDGARRAARRLRRQGGALHGVPVAVKDLVDVAGLPTAAGRARGRVAAHDAAIVAALRAAGAIVLGKTRTDELGLGTSTPGAVDPRDPERSVGGSSGGSAIAVAVGAAALAVATDTAGSARIPAAACGVAGLCPSANGLPRGGVTSTAPSCDRVGLIAAGADDLALAWRALTGRGWARPSRVVTLARSALGPVDPDRADAADRAAAALAGAASLVDRDSSRDDTPPCAGRAAAASLVDPDRAAAVVRLAAPSLRAFGAPRAVLVTAEAAVRHRATDAEAPAVRAQLEYGAAVSAGELAAARRALDDLGAELRRGIGDGVLVLPTLPGPPPRWDEIVTVEDQLRSIGRLTRLCGPVNTSGLVAASVPYGTDAGGRPLAVQLVAASEAAVLGAALAL
ncbi:MAG TPA: amidase family protein [Solirubrobacter sp.]|nr:amidase family protein [Solirubrobacter sp.]